MRKLIFITCLLTLGTFISYGQDKYNIEFVSKLTFNNSRLSNIWGYTNSSGQEYGLVGLTGFDNNQQRVDGFGLAIVDLRNPQVPYTMFKIPGSNSTWREVRTYKNYAYVTTEADDGVKIVNLGFLPDSIKVKVFRGEGLTKDLINDVHSLHIDGNFLYLYGGSFERGGATIYNITDPWNPVYVGKFEDKYIHDGFVSGDTAFWGHIYTGEIGVVDLSNKDSLKVITYFNTPGFFTHNSWLSKDKKTLFTTDEVTKSVVTSYDVSNLLDIKELDQYQYQTTDSPIVHNTYVLNDASITGFENDFVWSSYYSKGITVVDANRPGNLVEVGHFDSSPLEGNCYCGAWGVYPYFKSGNILISDMEGNMLVVKPNYKRAAYLEGFVYDDESNAPISNALIQLSSYNRTELSKFNGAYATGIPDSGYFSAIISRNGYNTLKVDSIYLQHGIVTNKNFRLKKGTIAVHQNNLSEFISVFPNPSNGIIKIKTNATQLNQLEIINSLGQSINNYQIENMLSIELPKGLYILNFTGSDGNYASKKVVVN